MFGSEYASTYDFVYSDKDYERECDLLESIFATHGRGDVRRVLDLGCGTGNHAIPLARRGYEVVGVDRADGMLEAARAKAREHGLDVTFHTGDVRSLDIPERDFDAATMLFAVLSYQTDDDDVIAALRSARRRIRDGGLVVFDVWFGPAVQTQRPERRSRDHVRDDGTVMRRVSEGALVEGRPLCDVTISMSELRDGDHVPVSSETHTMRYFTTEDIERFLDAADLRLLAVGSFPEFERKPDETTWNVMYVATSSS